MTRIEVRIRSLVVHGAHAFAGDAFSAALSAEIERRIGTGAGADVAKRFTGQAGSRSGTAAPATGPAAGTEAVSAARVAGRLLP
jgi:hypothetical protein